jgi:rRNA-processing protein FCF1
MYACNTIFSSPFYIKNVIASFQKRGLEINTAKSKTMKISKAQNNEKLNIKWNEIILEAVEQYSYLGVIITNDERIDKEIKNRIKKANQFIMR